MVLANAGTCREYAFPLSLLFRDDAFPQSVLLFRDEAFPLSVLLLRDDAFPLSVLSVG